MRRGTGQAPTCAGTQPSLLRSDLRASGAHPIKRGRGPGQAIRAAWASFAGAGTLFRPNIESNPSPVTAPSLNKSAGRGHCRRGRSRRHSWARIAPPSGCPARPRLHPVRHTRWPPGCIHALKPVQKYKVRRTVRCSEMHDSPAQSLADVSVPDVCSTHNASFPDHGLKREKSFPARRSNPRRQLHESGCTTAMPANAGCRLDESFRHD